MYVPNHLFLALTRRRDGFFFFFFGLACDLALFVRALVAAKSRMLCLVRLGDGEKRATRLFQLHCADLVTRKRHHVWRLAA